jgi:D-lactate dehydrogenase (cytochrome)
VNADTHVVSAAHRLTARMPRTSAAPRLERDRDLVRGFVEDAAHVPGGHAEAVAFPRDEAEVAALVASVERVLAVGAQSSLTGGATPRGEVVLSTRALSGIDVIDDRTVRAGAGVPLVELQKALAARGRYYPPVPTYEGAFIGGTIATNAAGAATFKYGTTRRWVVGITVVLATGEVLDLRRGDVRAHTAGWIEVAGPYGGVRRVTVPGYRLPDVPKHSAGYYAAAGMDAIDLFIGSEGTLGVIVDATLATIERPATNVALVPCASDAGAVDITAALRESPDVAGVEYMDSRSLALLPDDAFARAGLTRTTGPLLLVQVEGGIDAFAAIVDRSGVSGEIVVALADDERGAARLFELREAVPATVNQRVALAKAKVDPRIEKTAADMIVPFDRLADSLALYRATFERYGLDHAIWGHFSDGNLHPNVIPRSFADVERGKQAILEIGRRIVDMGGSPLAEHGVGRSPVKQALLRLMYGEQGIEEMRAVKRALDPEWKLAPGVIFQP